MSKHAELTEAIARVRQLGATVRLVEEASAEMFDNWRLAGTAAALKTVLEAADEYARLLESSEPVALCATVSGVAGFTSGSWPFRAPAPDPVETHRRVVAPEPGGFVWWSSALADPARGVTLAGEPGGIIRGVAPAGPIEVFRVRRAAEPGGRDPGGLWSLSRS